MRDNARIPRPGLFLGGLCLAPTNRVPLDFAAPVEVFLRTWKVNDRNQFRIRAAGALPSLTTWINGEKISELDTAKTLSGAVHA